jgi:hypothetical protein
MKELHKSYALAHAEEIRERSKKYREQNHERIDARHRAYFQSHKGQYKINQQRRRTLMKNAEASLTLSQWNIIKSEFNYCCAYCGSEEQRLSQDHFVALTNGGEFTHNNIIPSCHSCNMSKGARDFFTWYPQQNFYNKFREKHILNFLHYGKTREQQLAISI